MNVNAVALATCQDGSCGHPNDSLGFRHRMYMWPNNVLLGDGSHTKATSSW